MAKCHRNIPSLFSFAILHFVELRHHFDLLICEGHPFRRLAVLDKLIEVSTVVDLEQRLIQLNHLIDQF